jgi:hypothetical protein
MVGPGETLRSPWIPFAIWAWQKALQYPKEWNTPVIAYRYAKKRLYLVSFRQNETIHKIFSSISMIMVRGNSGMPYFWTSQRPQPNRRNHLQKISNARGIVDLELASPKASVVKTDAGSVTSAKMSNIEEFSNQETGSGTSAKMSNAGEITDLDQSTAEASVATTDAGSVTSAKLLNVGEIVHLEQTICKIQSNP